MADVPFTYIHQSPLVFTCFKEIDAIVVLFFQMYPVFNQLLVQWKDSSYVDMPLEK